MSRIFTLLLSSFFFFTPFAKADVLIGKPAPEFTAQTASGKTVSLSQFKGKHVILEWHNQGCPYVKKHYESGNMQKTQAEMRKKGAIWLTVISSAPGKQGHVTPKDALAYASKMKVSVDEILLDEKGEVGKLYGAKTTPHLFWIDSEGKLGYMGAMDSNSSSDPADIAGATNYILEASKDLFAGRPAKTAMTKAYGCSVKY